MKLGYKRLIYVLTWLIEAILVDIPVAESSDVRVLHINYLQPKYLLIREIKITVLSVCG